jgi:hypothetical protein
MGELKLPMAEARGYWKEPSPSLPAASFSFSQGEVLRAWKLAVPPRCGRSAPPLSGVPVAGHLADGTGIDRRLRMVVHSSDISPRDNSVDPRTSKIFWDKGFLVRTSGLRFSGCWT